MSKLGEFVLCLYIKYLTMEHFTDTKKHISYKRYLLSLCVGISPRGPNALDLRLALAHPQGNSACSRQNPLLPTPLIPSLLSPATLTLSPSG